MSGIVGIANLDGAPVDRRLLQRMTQSLAPRGPDAQTTWIGGSVGFGHTLLRTTWESADERQPHTLDGETWIVADCRVDAREELIRELGSRDASPDPNASDCDLILRAYSVWGPDCLDHLLGDFSFAIWDANRRTLFCARDHFGVKPFFYARSGETLIFSNDLSCVRLHPEVSDALDDLAVADFLVHGYSLDAERSSFAAIRRLPAADTLTASRGNVSIRRYWELPLEEEIRFPKRGDYIERFHELLEVAVRDWLRTNSVGIFMSGGLDSPSVAATAHRILSKSGSPFDLRAHTVVFDCIVPDEERKYSQLAADAIGIPIHHYPFDDFGFPSPEPEPDWYPPEPRFLFDRGRALAVHRPPAASSRVLLRADGADPLIESRAFELSRQFKARPFGGLLSDILWLVGARRQMPLLGVRTAVRMALGRVAPERVQPYPEWLAPALERRFDLRNRWRDEVAAEDIRPGFELTHSYWPLCFESFEPGTMRLAAETRYPFLDLRLARYLLRLGSIPWGPEKSLLRVAMKGVLPRQVLRRRKAPLAGNPWAVLLPPAHTSWWEEHMAPAPRLTDFVDVEMANATLARVAPRTQAKNEHRDIDLLRSSLRPLSLNLWLRQLSSVTRLVNQPLKEVSV